MSSITEVEKFKLEKLFSLGDGYVLNFSNQSFQNFIFKTIEIDIYQSKYEKFGLSKAKRLKALWDLENDAKTGKLLERLLLYFEAYATMDGEPKDFNKKLFDQCIEIANRLQGKTSSDAIEVTTIEDFLKLDVDEVSLSSLKIDSAVINILEQRVIEIKKCLSNDASLSVIFLCGSILEGILLGIATNKSKEFNQSSQSPKNKPTGKVKQFHEWSLSNFIDVAYDLRILGLDVKKFSHSLRDFRNYIHPYEQMSSGFHPDKHTAKMSWQVLKAAIHDIHENCQ